MLERFSVSLISREQITTVKKYIEKCKKEKCVSRFHYDATGGILAKPLENMKSIFHHVMVIPFKYSEIDERGSFVNIGELITCLHTSDNQEIFLRKFFQLASKQIKSRGKLFLLINDKFMKNLNIFYF